MVVVEAQSCCAWSWWVDRCRMAADRAAAARQRRPWRAVARSPHGVQRDRLRRWTADGTWDKVFAAAQVKDDGIPVEPRLLDRAGPPARRRCPQERGTTGVIGEALGRSRGGWSTKIHLAVDGRGRPLSILITPGQAGDNSMLFPVLDAIRVRAVAGAGEASVPTRCLPTAATRMIRSRPDSDPGGIRHVIPERIDQVERRRRKGRSGGRPPVFDRRPAAQSGRAVLQPTQAVKRSGHPLREADGHLRRASLIIAVTMIWLNHSQDSPRRPSVRR
jgi:transposase